MYHIMRGTEIVKSYKRLSSAEKWLKEQGIVTWEVCDKKTMPSLVHTWTIKEV